ncbi:hypothetical protein [Singulisphaera sp. PoT]|uniref:hypothetical protein n=1 Tax=Singulisphaera sp. PoT TaxID=3411797 RepID=UPI003BF4F91E
MRIRLRWWVLLFLPIGCTVETEVPRAFFPVTGDVSYQGSPVKRGTINFIPEAPPPQGVPATGEIVDGAIRNVTSRTQGDGVKLGKYRVTVIAYDEAYVKDAALRGPEGPDPANVKELAATTKALIPLRYGNARDSGLTAVVSPDGNDFKFKLVD